MTPGEFIVEWRSSELKERSGSQEHFIDLCRMLGEPTPADADPVGDSFCFERGAPKETGGSGWADVWKRHHFAWEYKGKHADLDAAFRQLRQYALALENPPLLIVSDMARFRIRTNWTNSVSRTHEFALEDLAEPGPRNKLKWALSDPERLRPGETRQSLTGKAAATFADLAQSLRAQGHDPEAVAHFVNRLVFCMFAEDSGLLPDDMFSRMLDQARRSPTEFATMARELFDAMATGGRVGFEAVPWFDGGLFDDDMALPMDREQIGIARRVAALDWSEIDPSIMGTLFERGLDPDKRSQLGAHYTDRDKIMRIVEPVVSRPLLAEWEAAKVDIAEALDAAEAARSPGARTRHRRRARGLLVAFLERLRSFTVLDPACGSGNFLYLALLALKDLEHRVSLEAEAMGFQREFPRVEPSSVKGIEINPYAAELARVSVWIGQTQWMLRNGYGTSKPILGPLDNIECRDAVLTEDGNQVEAIHADLTARRDGAGVDLTKAWRLPENAGIAFMGDTKGGPFDVPGDLAREWLRLPANPNGRANADVLKPWSNGMDITRRASGKWIVDFGLMVREEAAVYEVPYRHVAERVQPMRQRNRRPSYRDNWWRHVEPRPAMWKALDGLSRYIATPRVAKHRLFVWMDVRICPDSALIVIARDDDATFGILHSRFHEAWSLRMGTSLEDRPRYTPTTTFETFPFPEGLSPNIPVAERAADPGAAKIAEAARRLVELRERWLNPPEWVEWVEESASGYPPRSVPLDDEAAKQLKARTLGVPNPACRAADAQGTLILWGQNKNACSMIRA